MRNEEKKERIIFRCRDSNSKISKPYKFVLQRVLVSYDGIQITSSLCEMIKKKKKKRFIFRCRDSNSKILKPYKFVLQRMLVSYDGIKIKSSLYERAKKTNPVAKIQSWKFQSHINLCYNKCWYHMMEYISHQAYAKGQKKKGLIIFHYWDSNPKI
jgi:hypothetical protein